MKVLLIGGTGLLGSESAWELIRRGHAVRSVALPPAPAGALLPPEMELTFGNYMEMTDGELGSLMTGCEGFVFAAGIDERVEVPAPAYEAFRKVNIDPLRRLLRIARDCGVRHAVICGSYFVHFNRLWPHLRMAEHHPYIRSRVDQAQMALSFAGPDFDVAMLELPYIFGAQPGRKPVWIFLVEQIRSMWPATFWPRGGTAMVTVRQVAQCVAGALERNRGGENYPVGYYNMRWKELLAIVHREMGLPRRRVVTVPDWVFALGCGGIMRRQRKAGLEGGLNLVKFVPMMCSEAFIDKEPIAGKLGAQPDDIHGAIGESIRLCLQVLDGKTEAIGMKAE